MVCCDFVFSWRQHQPQSLQSCRHVPTMSLPCGSSPLLASCCSLSLWSVVMVMSWGCSKTWMSACMTLPGYASSSHHAAMARTPRPFPYLAAGYLPLVLQSESENIHYVFICGFYLNGQLNLTISVSVFRCISSENFIDCWSEFVVFCDFHQEKGTNPGAKFSKNLKKILWQS